MVSGSDSETLRNINHNGGKKLIGVFGWCQIDHRTEIEKLTFRALALCQTLFFTTIHHHFIFYLLSTAQITNKLWFDQQIRIKCTTGGEETS